MSRFGWNEDPAVDFCVEVDAIAGMEADVRAGLEDKENLSFRVFRAMQFRVGGVESAVSAKRALREIEARV